jgi:hypothetical protein
VRWTAVAALVVIVGCGSGNGDDDAIEATTTTTEAPATTARSTSTTAEASTTTTCPPVTGDPPVASVDLDDDGVDELWRPAGRGASTEIVELHRLDGCAEVPVLLEGLSAQFAIGGTVLLLQGLRCEEGRVVHLGATSDDGERYATVELIYELRDGELVRVDDRTGELTTSDPELQDFSSFEC